MINKRFNWYERTDYTTEERFLRTLESDKCRDLVYRRCYYYNNEQRDIEINKLWVNEEDNRKTASYGSHWGFYVGMDAITDYYVNKHAVDRSNQSAAMNAAGYKGDVLAGVSMFRMLNTPLIYIAEDGKTAQGYFFMGGQETLPRPEGKTEAYHLFGHVAVDFIRENEGWKIWHWAETYDFTPRVGEPSEKMPVVTLPEDQPFYNEFIAGKPTIEMVTHYQYLLSTDGWPAFPSAHKTYDLDHSCAPEAHPGIRTDIVDFNWAVRMSMLEAWGC